MYVQNISPRKVRCIITQIITQVVRNYKGFDKEIFSILQNFTKVTPIIEEIVFICYTILVQDVFFAILQ